MTTYILRTGSEVAVPAAPLVAQVQVSGPPFGHRWSVRGTTAQPPVIVRPDRIVLPSITEPTTLRIMPNESEPRFGPQSVLTVVIRHDRAAPDTDQVILDDVDLSGLSYRDLIQLIPDGRQIRVVGLRTVAETPLPPVAEIARDAAREVLGVPQVDSDDAIGLSARIDISASMRPALTDGSVIEACNVLAGIATVVSPGQQLIGTAAGLTSHRLGAAAPDRFAAEMAAALAPNRDNVPAGGGSAGGNSAGGASAARPGSGTGFRSATQASPADPRTRTVVVTSGVPADRRRPADQQVLILGTPGRSIDWPGVGAATVIDRGGLIAVRPDREAITAAVGSLLAAIQNNGPLQHNGEQR